MNKTLERMLDQITVKRLEDLKMAVALGGEERITAATKSVVIIGTKTATGSLVYMARHTKDAKVRAILAQQIAAYSPLRQEYRRQLLEIPSERGTLALIYAGLDDTLPPMPTWHERADTFDDQKIEDTHWLEQILQG